MALNDDFASRELSIEELEAIAAGSILGWIKKEIKSGINWLEHNPTGQRVSAAVAVGSTVGFVADTIALLLL